jgi:hypothetical protein
MVVGVNGIHSGPVKQFSLPRGVFIFVLRICVQLHSGYSYSFCFVVTRCKDIFTFTLQSDDHKIEANKCNWIMHTDLKNSTVNLLAARHKPSVSAA